MVHIINSEVSRFIQYLERNLNALSVQELKKIIQACEKRLKDLDNDPKN